MSAPRHLHLDLVGGIAGDMTVAALLDAGAPSEALREALGASGLPACEFEVRREWRGGLAGTRFVVAPERGAPHRDWADIRRLLDAGHRPGRTVPLDLGDLHRLAEAAGPAPAEPPRSGWDPTALDDYLALVRQHDLEGLDIFGRLARAEAAAHGCALDEVHFHEVGALDAIVDVVGAALGVHLLGAGSFSASTVPVCQGRVQGDHGWMPLPALITWIWPASVLPSLPRWSLCVIAPLMT